jgi:hypothetical protein
MSYRCIFGRRRFLPYLEGGVAPREAKRLERHLAGCRECDEFLARLRSGDQAGRQFGRLGPDASHRPPEFEEIWTAVGSTLDRPGRPAWTGGKFLRALSTPLAVRILIALVLTQAVLLVVSNREAFWRANDGAVVSPAARDFRGFTSLRIPEFSSDVEYQVVTEGFVQNVYFDEEEKTLHIKLVEILHQQGPFVICEIRNLAGMTIPPEGSRVRVYGTARYDPQPGRGWHEVNPVLTMAVLKR